VAHEKDLYAERKRQTASVLIFTLVGMLSTPLALLFYSSRSLKTAAAITGYDTVFYHYIVVGVAEEAAKLAIFIVLYRLRKSIKNLWMR